MHKIKGVPSVRHELRVDYGPGYRVYYTLEGNRLILLLVGGDKESQTTGYRKGCGVLPGSQKETSRWLIRLTT